MIAISKTCATLAALSLILTSATPLMAQSESNAGGGVQTNSKQSPADKQLAQRVYDKLSADQVGYYKHVTVSADNGVVTLGGSIDTTAALNNAKKIAGGVPGVTKVVDRMALEPAPTRSAGQ
jgi:hyperosmotically inducible periplasmic protein